MKEDTDEEIAAWNKRLASRRHLKDWDILKKDDAIWKHGDWHPIPDRHVGLIAGDMEFFYPCHPRPTFGRIKK